MLLRLRECDTGTSFVVDTLAGRVCADSSGRGGAGWADEPDPELVSHVLASARQYAQCYARAVPGTYTPDLAFQVRGPLTQAEQATLAAGGAVASERPPLQLHLDFFDADLDGWITLSEGYRAWRALGFSTLAALLKTVLSALVFGQFVAGWPRLLAIDITRLTRRRYASTGIFLQDGSIDAARLQSCLSRFDAALGRRLSFDETIALLDSVSQPGAISHSQFRSLFAVCRRLNGNVDVINKAQFIGLFDSSLLWRVASMTGSTGRRAPWLQPAAGPG